MTVLIICLFAAQNNFNVMTIALLSHVKQNSIKKLCDLFQKTIAYYLQLCQNIYND